jgi:hypothetical protein
VALSLAWLSRILGQERELKAAAEALEFATAKGKPTVTCNYAPAVGQLIADKQ